MQMQTRHRRYCCSPFAGWPARPAKFLLLCTVYTAHARRKRALNHRSDACPSSARRTNGASLRRSAATHALILVDAADRRLRRCGSVERRRSRWLKRRASSVIYRQAACRRRCRLTLKVCATAAAPATSLAAAVSDIVIDSDQRRPD
jgi:hypothetical protein